MRKNTKEEFINKAVKIHGDRYNYSKVNYKNHKTKVKIICKKHGEFLQTPESHLRGYGCRICTKYTTGIFIEKAKAVHDDKYDYIRVDYKNSKTKVKIICKEHGEFFQIPAKHLFGNGCPKCSFNKTDTKEFITKARKIHGNRYDYSKVDYKKHNINVTIICKKHGEFLQTPNNHLKNNCPKCSQVHKHSIKEFINKAKEVHKNRYIYNMVNYKNSKTKITIVCRRHGEFSQTPNSHLVGRGCPKCVGKVSRISQKWLDELNIPNENREKSLKIGKKLFILDALDVDNKIAYEFNGDFWHGNPKIYNPNDKNVKNNVTFKELYIRTVEKRKTLENNGFTVVSIWEDDFRKTLK